MKYFNDLVCFNQSEIAHDVENIFFLEKNCSHEGTWTLLQLDTGEIDLQFIDGEGEVLSAQKIAPSTPWVMIPPATWYQIVPISEIFYGTIEFYCKPHRFFSKKHNLNSIHDDVYELCHSYLAGEKELDVFDVGCGSGRNSLYFSLMGHNVTAIDRDEHSLQKLEHIARVEQFKNVNIIQHDLNRSLKDNDAQYDLVLSTVTLQFLNPNRVPHLLSELQSKTKPMGLHFIVHPIFSENFELPSSFTYLPESKSLYHFYQDKGWSVIEYKESVGQLQKLDEKGRPIQGVFAILLTQKHGVEL